jgi:iron(III) transport system ATP-binding protein
MLSIENVSIRFGSHTAVDNVTMRLATGQMGCLLGPSGCGKTTLLRAIAGFTEIQAGKIALHNQICSTTEMMQAVQTRGVGFVMQDFALFPHLTVAQNIAFGLHQSSREVQAQRCAELLALIQLEAYADSYPHVLSGGQQQRVAIARALAPKPQILLLDEPFSALDPELREGLASDIKRILQSENVTSLLVTHDQSEAFAFADIIAVMQQGKIAQYDTSYGLYHRPVSPFVAKFIGEGCLVDVILDSEGVAHTPFGQIPIAKTNQHAQSGQIESSQSTDGQNQCFQMLLRPDDVIHDDQSELQGIVISKAFRGPSMLYGLSVAGTDTPILCLAPSHHVHAVGMPFGFRLDIAHVQIFPVQTD